MLTNGVGGYLTSRLEGANRSQSLLGSRSRPEKALFGCSWHGPFWRTDPSSGSLLARLNNHPQEFLLPRGSPVDTYQSTPIASHHICMCNVAHGWWLLEDKVGTRGRRWCTSALHITLQSTQVLQELLGHGLQVGIAPLAIARMLAGARSSGTPAADLEKTSGSSTTDWTRRSTWRHNSSALIWGRGVMSARINLQGDPGQKPPSGPPGLLERWIGQFTELRTHPKWCHFLT